MDCSTLAYIDVTAGCAPFELFEDWLGEAKSCGGFKNSLFSLATSSLSGRVSNRTVVLRDFKDNNLIFISNKDNKKSHQIAENPNVAACFLWLYKKDENFINRQVRVEGTAKEISREDCRKYFENESLLAQVRAHLGKQGQKVNWDELKTKYDEILKEVKENGMKINLPQHVTAYKITPNYFDFYYSFNEAIADRIIFEEDENEWTFERVGT
nr:uncharacterized protein LOC111516162 [Leptinotarsa decemlineata]